MIIENGNRTIDYAMQTKRLQQIAKDLLAEKSVQVVLGFRENEESGAPSPLFARTPEDADQLIWSENCWRNLSPYLLPLTEKAAIAVRPCDARAVINLLAEHQLQRDRIILIGMECCGMKKDGVLSPGCDTCPSSVPNLFDYVVGAHGTDAFLHLPMPSAAEDAAEWYAQSTVEERRERFLNEIEKCILCYSCRQACPGCYCEVCFVDRKMTPWNQADIETADKAAFHLTRAMHLAGRCVACGACENVCPSGVNLKYLYDGVQAFIEEMYDFTPGVDPERTQAMNYFTVDDKEVGFLGGEAK